MDQIQLSKEKQMKTYEILNLDAEELKRHFKGFYRLGLQAALVRAIDIMDSRELNELFAQLHKKDENDQKTGMPLLASCVTCSEEWRKIKYTYIRHMCVRMASTEDLIEDLFNNSAINKAYSCYIDNEQKLCFNGVKEILWELKNRKSERDRALKKEMMEKLESLLRTGHEYWYCCHDYARRIFGWRWRLFGR